MISDQDYCRTLVAAKDHGLYIAALTMPRRARELLWPLLALRVTLEDVPNTVSDPTLGYIRLAWWREEIARLGAGRAADPVLKALAVLSLPAEAFEPLFEAAERGIEKTESRMDQAFQTLADRVLAPDSGRWARTDAARRGMLKAAEGTKWQGHPPFFALRMFLASAFGRGA